MTDTELLVRVGEALYGEHWRSALARDLSVTDRTMRRWVDKGPPPKVWSELLVLIEGRGTVLSDLADALRGRL